eukprot:TRINITY_DN1284_c0_g1_i1.p1 TRINITY_DN1284_c0_g1~~TRINITY_DN1284_c0_g1_i1.p1  ORF type:complete len:153 (+),score=7.45 TRINITY_DN1284_c0_g1_i1:79-537(+)
MKVIALCLFNFFLLSLAAPSDLDPVITAFYETQNAKACDKFVNLFAPNFTVTDPAGTPPVSNLQDLMQNCKDTDSVFQTVEISIERYFSAGAAGTAVVWHCKNLARNGCKVDFEGVDTFVLTTSSPSRIQTVTGYFDPSIPAQQMNCTTGLI